jgi:hypothetical protein
MTLEAITRLLRIRDEKLQNRAYELYYICLFTGKFRTCEQIFIKSDTKEL